MAALLKTTQIQEPSSATVNIALDSSGNVGIGTTSPSYPLDVAGTGVVRISPTTGTNQATLLASNTGGNFYFGKNDSAGSQFATDVYASVVWSSGNRPIVFATNGTEYMRLNSSGNLLVGTTAVINASNAILQALNVNGGRPGINVGNSVGSAATNCIIFTNSNGTVGTIQTSGTATSFNTSSDYRLKENVTPMTTGLATVSALKPVNYDWISDKSEGEGFIAHELQAIIPHAVTGTKDAVDTDGKPVYQGVDYSKIVVHLVAAIQEQQATIASLATRIATLEAK